MLKKNFTKLNCELFIKMNGKSQSRNQPNTNLKYSNSYISLSKYVLGRNKKNERSLTSSLSFTINQQERFKNRDNYIFEITDLNGEMFKKKFRDPSPTLGNWDNFLNKSLNHDRSNKTKQYITLYFVGYLIKN